MHELFLSSGDRRPPSPPVSRYAVIMTCHDRRKLTVSCLASLFAARETVEGRVTLTVYLVDDGCTDGTADAVRSEFPDVRVVPGSGTLYWCGGMRHAWRTAAQDEHDAYLWLNDDVTLARDALEVLHDTSKQQERESGSAGIVVGSTAGEDGERPSYGSLSGPGVVEPGALPRPIRLFNGNIVLVSDSAYRKVGNLSRAYSHSFGDLDYGIRAERHGISVWLAPGYLGHCNTNKCPKWKRPDVPLGTRLRELHRPTGCPPWELAYLMWQDRAWWAPYTIAKLYASVLFPPSHTT